MVKIEIEVDEDMRKTLVMAGMYYQVSVEKAAELLLLMGLSEFAKLLAAQVQGQILARPNILSHIPEEEN